MPSHGFGPAVTSTSAYQGETGSRTSSLVMNSLSPQGGSAYPIENHRRTLSWMARLGLGEEFLRFLQPPKRCEAHGYQHCRHCASAARRRPEKQFPWEGEEAA